MLRIIASLLGRGQSCLLGTILVEGPFAHQFPFVKARHELVHYRLERGVRFDVRLGVVDDHLAARAESLLSQVINEATVAEGVQTLDDGGGIDQISLAQVTDDVRIDGR